MIFQVEFTQALFLERGPVAHLLYYFPGPSCSIFSSTKIKSNLSLRLRMFIGVKVRHVCDAKQASNPHD